MNGTHFSEIEALRNAERDLGELHRCLMRRTYFAVPKAQLSF